MICKINFFYQYLFYKSNSNNKFFFDKLSKI